jgi:hypothetical protein
MIRQRGCPRRSRGRVSFVFFTEILISARFVNFHRDRFFLTAPPAERD